LGIFTAHWRSAILASAVELEVFAHLEKGNSTLADLSSTLQVPTRPLQAILDGLAAFGLVRPAGAGQYEVAELAKTHLVKGKPGYLGGFARIVTGAGDGGMRQWSRLPEAIRLGQPIEPETILEPDSPFWPELVMALLPLSCEAAHIAARLLDLDIDRPLSILDVGGGGGAYALSWLPINARARVVQIDWAPVNALALRNLESKGLGERFATVDGDFRAISLGVAEYDIVVLSNICHHESPEQIVELFKRIAAALVAGGRLLVSEFVLSNDRVGPLFAACFGAGMALQTATGASYRYSDYLEWLSEAGFETVVVDQSHPLSSLFVAGVTKGRALR
jgi:SAM-dependent methyltransferase